MRDNLPDKPKNRECGIVNLDSSINHGTHWVCYYKDHNMKIYFDSFGLFPPIEIQNYLGSDILTSTFQVQKFNTNHCGHLCLDILSSLSKGEKFENIILNFESYK